MDVNNTRRSSASSSGVALTRMALKRDEISGSGSLRQPHQCDLVLDDDAKPLLVVVGGESTQFAK